MGMVTRLCRESPGRAPAPYGDISGLDFFEPAGLATGDAEALGISPGMPDSGGFQGFDRHDAHRRVEPARLYPLWIKLQP
jgi:hypothetical protein